MDATTRTHSVGGTGNRPFRRSRTMLTSGLLVALVVAALGVLLVLPRLATRRMEQLRDHIDSTVMPARRHVALVGQALALEVAAARGFALTGEPSYAQAFHRALEMEEAEMARLRQILPRVSDSAA